LHSGLGLSICQAMASNFDAELTANLELDRLQMRLSIPQSKVG